MVPYKKCTRQDIAHLASEEIVFCTSPGPDDASVDEFDDLVTYDWILHVIL